MPSATGQIKSAAWAFIALALLGWILGLIGLAGTQAQCYHTPSVGSLALGRDAASNGGPLADNLPMLGIRGLNRSYRCERMYSYYWFMLAGEFVTLAGLTVLSIMGLLAASALSWMAWLTVLSLLFIQGADTFLALKDLGLTGRDYSFAALTAAGWIIMAIANLALIYLLGWRPRKNSSSGTAGPIKY